MAAHVLINNSNIFLLTAVPSKFDIRTLQIVPQQADSHTNIYEIGVLSKVC